MKQISALLFLLIWLGNSETAHTHARLADSNAVPPRSTNPGLKNFPCGGVATANTSLVYDPGATLTINWIETINHPGNYFIEFSPGGDTQWVRLKTIADDKNDGNLPHSYSTTVTLPNTPCTDCALRLIQEMTDRNPPTYYYSCSNRFTVRTPAGGNPNGGGGGSSSGGTPAPDQYGDDARNAEETCH